MPRGQKAVFVALDRQPDKQVDEFAMGRSIQLSLRAAP
jgi:hypothetical protein